VLAAHVQLKWSAVTEIVDILSDHDNIIVIDIIICCSIKLLLLVVVVVVVIVVVVVVVVVVIVVFTFLHVCVPLRDLY